ncbi:hypothetical protein E2C01_052916 [Portunus trituberculatus]|uniref:Secreted protein n=1 Tax=Portunus trituberculatus TaxID=210409 RepID=A0A5B7GN49_PORTR|nr:hypothetical protein [Portunus trituberculatus]
MRAQLGAHQAAVNVLFAGLMLRLSHATPLPCLSSHASSPRPTPAATHDGKEAAAVVFVQVPAASRWHGVAPASTPDLPVITPPPPDVTHTPLTEVI